MKKTFWYLFVVLFAFNACIENAMAIPASRKLSTLKQPDGKSLDVYIKGDEFFHYVQSTDGFVLLPDKNGFYTYAEQDSTGDLCSGKITASNTDRRTQSENIYLRSVKPGLFFSEAQRNKSYNRRIQNALIRKNHSSNLKAGSTSLKNGFLTTGSTKSLIILVNFSDVKFSSLNDAVAYSNMFNQEGYNQNGHVGSVRDYFKFNSSGIFTPEFDVVGPVTLPNPMAYYGQNDKNGNDLHPAEMIVDACNLVAKQVDFSKYDFDFNNVVDNIYVYYAGKGEADGGGANSIWPHSWVIEGEGLALTLNGKKISQYACSSELSSDGKRTGIGTFTHEFSHTLGLPDMYDVDYDNYNGQGFDLGEWSLMAYGSYNADGSVPPGYSLLERSLLGWAEPVSLDQASEITLTDLGSTNQGYILNTTNEGEFYLLENRQNDINPWDAFLPHHGLLIYHIDMRKDAFTSVNYWGTVYELSFMDLWGINLVNAISSHQCVDMIEADNSRVFASSGKTSAYYTSLKGDPFPGSKMIDSFTFTTTPTMKSWDGQDLNKPITYITEKNNIISFDFMGGIFNQPPVVKNASETGNYRFTANWNSLPKAVSYFLDVYTLEIAGSGDTIRTFVPGYENLAVVDTFCLVNDLRDISDYYYVVRATNGYTETLNSKFIKVSTSKASSISQYSRDRTISVKGNDHDSVIKVYNSKGLLCQTTTENKIAVNQAGLYLVEALFEGKTKILKVLVE